MNENWLIGIKGAAYDLPSQKRAYSYTEQPHNAAAAKLGIALHKAAAEQKGDFIDRGLQLLKVLEEQGFGVFELKDN
jgi:hypothetical protein